MSVSLPPAEKVAETVNKHGMANAARLFNTSAPTLCRMLKKHGYRIQRVYILPPEAEAVIRENKGAA